MQETQLNLGTLVRSASTTFAEGLVITCTGQGTTRQATYGEVAERAGRLANALRGFGITGDERVGTFLWNNQEHLEAYLAVPSMGAVLHTLNIRLTADQIAWIANNAEDQVVIVDHSLVPLFAPVLPHLETVRTILVTGECDLSALQKPGVEVLSYSEVVSGSSPVFSWPDVDERNAAAMCYTSGTTGDPKGVVYSHRSSYLHSMMVCAGNIAALTHNDRVLPVVPMFHANAWGLPYAALMAGCDLAMPDRFLQPEPLVGFIEATKPTAAGAVPTIWNDMLQWLRKEKAAGREHHVSSIGRVLCGGSAVPRSLIENYMDELDIDIQQAWGMTETSPVATSGLPPAGLGREETLDLKATAGRFAFGVEGRIVDDEGAVQPWDGKSVGEVQVHGPWITGSYFKGADDSRFDTDAQGNVWLRTGDVGLIDPRGYLTLTDRSKDVIKSGGEWISSVELETTLMGHPDVAEACVIGVPDEKWQERPLALVVRSESSDVTAEALRDWLGSKVAKWWLPERWTFVPSVPRTGVGKFDKKVARKAYADGEYDVVTL